MPDDAPLTCPRCNVPLKEVRTSGGLFYACDGCGGRVVTIELLRKRFTAESINALCPHAMRGQGRAGRLALLRGYSREKQKNDEARE